eukprot:2338936-Pleurochrysis_carterae.AAC.2
MMVTFDCKNETCLSHIVITAVILIYSSLIAHRTLTDCGLVALGTMNRPETCKKNDQAKV